MKSLNNPKDKAPSVRAKLDKAWEHVTHVEENGEKVFICNFCRKVIRGGGINRVKKHLAGRNETDHKPKEKVSIVISDDGDDEEQDDVTLLNKGPRADHLVIQPVHKGLAENELREIIAEEVARAIQAAMPAILEQNTKIVKICIRVGPSPLG
ncbi:DNA binding protein [Tanacetum coccineum]